MATRTLARGALENAVNVARLTPCIGVRAGQSKSGFDVIKVFVDVLSERRLGPKQREACNQSQHRQNTVRDLDTADQKGFHGRPPVAVSGTELPIL
jgi:hypothetical protein